ncbi:MAG: 50S ribosomal protein L11 methyltransferase [Cardiobacteriaceae bacterium]|nr:50S ribosomal protein L11 methyltransferase [Cardiobacteriaceae bacterium]
MNQKDWLELSLIANGDEEALLFETALELAGAIATTATSASEEEIFEPEIGTTPLWKKSKITGLFALDADKTQVLESLKTALGEEYAHAIVENLLADCDWIRAWLDYFQPISFAAGRLWVAAQEHDLSGRADKNAAILRLDPGLAFGTGTHPSTALCLEYLAGNNLSGKTVFDYGSGSGILGIACALLGAEKIYQTDIDPQAIQASRENAEKNNVAEKITVTDKPETVGAVDLLVANILLEPLCALKTEFEKHSREFIFAGILERQEEVIRRNYPNYQIEKVAEKDGWICLRLLKS